MNRGRPVLRRCRRAVFFVDCGDVPITCTASTSQPGHPSHFHALLLGSMLMFIKINFRMAAMTLDNSLRTLFGDRRAPDGSLVWNNFAKWFKASKATAANGSPLMVFHGTVIDGATYNTPRGNLPKNAFTIFEKTRLGGVSESPDAKVGFWFSSSLQRAEEAAQDARAVAEDDCKSCYIFKVYLSMQNPIVLDNVRDYGTHEVARLAKRARKAGHDGLIFLKGERGGSDFLVFEPNQIKSAEANCGAYDPEDPSIDDGLALRRAIDLAQEARNAAVAVAWAVNGTTTARKKGR